MFDYLGLHAAAESVYRMMLEHPDWDVEKLAAELDVGTDAVRAALDELFELSLLRESVEQQGRLRPVSPRVGLQSLLARQEADLERRKRQITESQAAMAAMVAEFADRQEADEPVGVERVAGMDLVQQRLEELADDIKVEALSFMPVSRSPNALAAGARNNTGLLARGVEIRTAMQDSVRNDKPTLAYARALTDAGGEVRTAPVLPPRMLISDRCTAVVPIDPASTAEGVLVLTGRGVVASLVALFEQVWSTAVPLGAAKSRNREGVTAQERELLSALGQGYTDESAAKRLGVSERTCRRMMTDLMERLGARSRFEAGLLAAKAGWL